MTKVQLLKGRFLTWLTSWLAIGILATFLLISLIILSYQLVFTNRIYWGVKVAGINLSGLSPQEAVNLLSTVSQKQEQKIQLSWANSTFTLSAQKLELTYNLTKTVNQALLVGRHSHWLSNLKHQYLALTTGVNLPLEFNINYEYLDDKVNRLATLVEKPAKPPTITYQNQILQITPGETGQQLDKDQLKKTIYHQLAWLETASINLPITTTGYQLTTSQQETIKKQAEKLTAKKVVATFEARQWIFDQDKIANLLTVSIPNPQSSPQLVIDRAKLDQEVATIAKAIDRPAQNARFQMADGKVTVFSPSVNGQAVKREELTNLLEQTLLANNPPEEIKIPVTITEAPVKTSQVNSLGINELIGRGVSSFAGSPPERIHNIKLATSRLNGILIAPGETFSFNNAVGEISVATGYTTAYIISKGRTILGEGGGVCQVSTTIFRAAVNTGLPIEERFAHAYRVSYYEKGGSKVGLDATIFAPSVDLKFKNDTPAYILVQGYIEGTNLIFDFYGTKDNRVVEISNPQISNLTPPPPPLYEEDPTLPAGVVKQIDFAATGADVKIIRTVRKNGQIETSTFISHYKPWQAVYKVGTKTN